MDVSSNPTETGVDKRRTTRVVQAIPIIVHGMDALGQPFKEVTSTVMVNCNGCKYRSRHYVPKDSRVTVEIRALRQGAPPRIVPSRVVWVQRPQTFREVIHVALEFEVAGNLWGIDAPPEDWYPHPDDVGLEIPVSADGAESEASGAPAAGNGDARVEATAPPAVNETVIARARAETLALPEVRSPFAMQHVPPTNEAELAAARELVMRAVEAMMAPEIPRLRERLEAQLPDSIGESVKSLALNLAEEVAKDVARQAADRTAAIVVEGRKACKESVAQLDKRIRYVVQDVINSRQASQRKASRRRRRRKDRKIEPETVVTVPEN